MIQLGLIGYPIGHSLSPKIHTANLKACNLEGSYSLFPVESDDRQGLKDLLVRVRSGEIIGLNVTIPHKQHVLELMDEVTPTAKTIGAVNTIYMRENKLVGDNTDAQGFLSDLRRFLTTETKGHGDPNALVLGAGGSARAVIYALLNDGWKVTIAARRMEQARELSEFFINHQLHTVDSVSNAELSNIALIVNTTPVGMIPNVDRSPWPENLLFPKDAAIYDLVYNPRETKLVGDARRQGLKATTGLGMLLEQAALGFQLWTEKTPPRHTLLEFMNH